MKTLIIYQSIHHGNTEKVAKKIAEVLGADLKKPNEVKPEDLADYDLIGFGSGIYYSKFHVTMLKFVDSLPEMSGKKTFIFYTHGAPVGKFGKKFAEKLTAKGLSELKSKMPHTDLSAFRNNPDINKLGDLFTVNSIVNYITNKLDVH
jgi:Flavodoxins